MPEYLQYPIPLTGPFEAIVPGAEPNCVGYVFHQLGLLGAEVYFNPRSAEFYQMIDEQFSIANSPEEAVAAAVVFDIPWPNEEGKEQYIRQYVHIGLVNPADPRLITSRKFIGMDVPGPVVDVDVDSLRDGYANDTLGIAPKILYLARPPQTDASDTVGNF